MDSVAANSQSHEQGNLFSIQAEELSRVSMAESDFDLAYWLQLQEALAASRAIGHGHSTETDPQVPHPPPPALPDHPNDRSFAISLQSTELYKCQQQASDLQQIARESKLVQIELKRRAHDAKFAQFIAGVGDSDWESHGDECEDPFEDFGGEDAQELLYCKLYVTAVSSGDDDCSEFGIGAVILDSCGNVLSELRKPLKPESRKGVADYVALISGLEMVHTMGLCLADAYTDSVLVYNQVLRRWRARSGKHKELLSQTLDHARKLQQFNLFLVPCNENNHAVRLAREVVNRHLPKESGGTSEIISEVNSFCTICLERKCHADMFAVSGCLHSFCRICIIQHSEVKVQSGQVPIRCPQFGCIQTLGLDQCLPILSQKWYDLYNKRLIEARMPEAERVYCPFPNCSALMSRKEIAVSQGASTSNPSSSCITATRCKECHRVFCVECRAPWHASMSCEDYQRLPPSIRNAQDAELYKLAEHKNWKRCKMCKRMIELSEGCYHITCRCGHEFCYLCGEPWKDGKQTCRCRLFDEDYLLDEPVPTSDDEDGIYWDEDDYEYSEDLEDDYDDMVSGAMRTVLSLDSPRRNTNPHYKTKLCRFWQRGECHFGDDCNFAHGVDELREVMW